MVIFENKRELDEGIKALVMGMANGTTWYKILLEVLGIYACSGEANKNYFDIDFKGPKALIFGSEEKGIQKFLSHEANGQIKISIDSRLESLNVSNATSVILFEAKRQRT